MDILGNFGQVLETLSPGVDKQNGDMRDKHFFINQ